nr:MAG TPA: hypothetical protein [Caudoviricetes sp.]
MAPPDEVEGILPAIKPKYVSKVVCIVHICVDEISDVSDRNYNIMIACFHLRHLISYSLFCFCQQSPRTPVPVSVVSDPIVGPAVFHTAGPCEMFGTAGRAEWACMGTLFRTCGKSPRWRNLCLCGLT